MVPDRRDVDGRIMITRAEIARASGLPLGTVSRLSRKPGYPCQVRLEGRLYVDAQAWERFWAAERVWTAGGDRLDIDGVGYISSAERARRTGRSVETVRGWSHLPGHPAEIRPRHGHTYVVEAAWSSWYADYAAGLQARLTAVDRSGDPDELIGPVEASRVLGYLDDTVRSLHRSGWFMTPDDEELLGRGRTRPLWRRARVWEFGARRSGPGGGRGARAAMRPDPDPASPPASPPPSPS